MKFYEFSHIIDKVKSFHCLMNPPVNFQKYIATKKKVLV